MAAADRYGYVEVIGSNETMVPALEGARGFREIAKMVATDDTIGAMMWTTETTLAQVVWKHEPRDNGKPSTDQRAVAAAAFANEVLADMAHSYADHVEDAVTMIPYGFSVSEIQFKRRDGQGSRFNDGLWGIDCLLHLEQKATTGWGVKDGKAVSYKTMTTTGEREIPLFKALHYTVRGNVTKPAGRTLFSNLHRSWTFKNNIQESEAIGIRRELAGLPIAKVPKSDLDLALKAKLKGDNASVDEKAAQARIEAMLKAATKMRFNETAGMVIPSDPYPDPDGNGMSNIRQYEFDILTGAGQRTVDTNSAIGRYDRAIARCLLMQFLHLGDRSTGSYNLSENQSSLALRSMRALIGKILGEWQRKALRVIWALNGMDMRWLPEMVSSPLTEDDLNTLGQFLDRLANAMDLLNQEPELKKAMFARVGVTPNKDVEAQLPQDRPDPAVTPPDPVDA